MFCDVYGNICFEKSMNNVTLEDICDCPNECNSISYSFSVVSTPFDPKEMCPRNVKKESEDFLMKEFYLNKFPPQFVRRLIEFSNVNVSSREGDYCERNIQYRAEINFRLATNSISVTTMSRRLSFFDQLSAFGKNCSLHFIDKEIFRSDRISSV